MNVAMIAVDTKKELLIRLCLAYRGVLKRHTLICTSKTGNQIKKQTGLDVVLYLDGMNGGLKQITSRVILDEIDLVIYLRDSLIKHGDSGISYELEKMCDVYSVPLATNIATAEALVLALSRGDLNWRMFVNPVYNKTKS